MRAASLILMLLALTILHPGIALAAAVVTYITARKRRPAVPRARLVASVARFPTRAEALAQRFGRVG
jgi:hypothetical protein